MMTETIALTTGNIPCPDIVDRCISGERPAQKQLYDQYKTAMFSVAFRILNDFDQASDVLQDAFLEVFLDLRSFQRKSTLGAWIKTIVIRHAVRKSRFEFRYQPFDINEHDGITEQLQHTDAQEINRAL